MTQVFNPFLEKVAAENLQSKAAREAGLHKRMCWVCQKDKPTKGGTYPNRGNRRGSVRGEQFRCEDCTARLAAKKVAKEIE